MRAGDAGGAGGARPALRPRLLSTRPAPAAGAWRRRPDAKWRLKPANLAQRQAEQRAMLAMAAPLVKPGGRLVYVTCSVLPEENDDQIAAGSWRTIRTSPALPWRDAWTAGDRQRAATVRRRQRASAAADAGRHGTDGFFIALMRRHDLECGERTPHGGRLQKSRLVHR